ncbi:hypothetical protein [Parablautia intestinalis]|uniref:hypothetical protein n=1 Tax=Parablautia intestinalis TaxID=2320100 RepID=UPI00256F0E85|nr:hypothetical protein [Parablautia intestinalis]
MLGKTNITTLKEGAIVTEIEDYRWIQQETGINGNFIKAIYNNEYLVAISKDGVIAYTMDGEVWNSFLLEYADCRLNDIDWDGNRFILSGSYTDDGTSNETGLILTTNDFRNYNKINIENEDTEYLCVYPVNGKYIVFGVSSSAKAILGYIGNLESAWEKTFYVGCGTYTKGTASVAKTSNEILLGFGHRKSGPSGGSYYYDTVCKITNDGRSVTIYDQSLASAAGSSSGGDRAVSAIYAFECKDTLFYRSALAISNYIFAKVLSSNEEMALSTDINYMFVDGAYFNNCQVFINNHGMLVVKKNESIMDKTLDNLIEIAPEFTMNCIAKAFGRLYIFGNRGVILKSSVETNNEDSILVQTLSAKKALEDAKAYTDMKINELKELLSIDAGQAISDIMEGGVQ